MKIIEKITPVILAGGLGTRLRSVIPTLPKVLAPINGKPFLSYLFDQLLIAGFDRVVLSVGYKADLLKETFGAAYKELAIEYSLEAQPLGTGGGLRLALDLVQSGYILAMNGDSYVDLVLTDFISWYFKGDYSAALLLLNHDDTDRFGRVETDNACRVLQFHEKKLGHGPGLINGGVYLLKAQMLKSWPRNKLFSLENNLFPELIANELYGYIHKARFIDIGTPESYNLAEGFFRDNKP